MTLPEIQAAYQHLGPSVGWLALGALYAAAMGVWNLVDDYRDARAERGQR